jgi:tetrahydromethanopterin S-methyltransferase subunit B
MSASVEAPAGRPSTPDLEAQPLDMILKEVEEVRVRVEKLEELSDSESHAADAPAPLVVVPLQKKAATSAGSFM